MAGDEGKGEWEKGIDERVCTTRLKKKAAPYFELMNEKKKSFSVEVILKIFKFSFILDQSQIRITNGLGDRAVRPKTAKTKKKC